MPRAVKNPDQGAMLMHSMYGGESVAADDRQFTRKPDAPTLPDAPSIEMVGRNTDVMSALGKLGIIMETAPAVRAETDADPKQEDEKALRSKFGSEYEVKVADMRDSHERENIAFDALFKKIWGLDVVKKSGLVTSEKASAQFTEDKQKFVSQFTESGSEQDGVSLAQAKTNRRKYRTKLRKQEKVYRAENLGVWPEPAKKKRSKRTA